AWTSAQKVHADSHEQPAIAIIKYQTPLGHPDRRPEPFSFFMHEHRTLRVAEAVREELSEIIGFETEDTRLLAIEVLEAHVSPDGRHATVRVAVRGTGREQKESMAALEHARHYLRHELAIRLSLRHVPELHF